LITIRLSYKRNNNRAFLWNTLIVYLYHKNKNRSATKQLSVWQLPYQIKNVRARKQFFQLGLCLTAAINEQSD